MFDIRCASIQPATSSCHRFGCSAGGLAGWPTPVASTDAAGLLAYACGSYAVALNNGPERATISLAGWTGGRLLLATEEGVFWQSRSASLSLPPYAGACVRQE